MPVNCVENFFGHVSHNWLINPFYELLIVY